jgi:hypothetical protein
MGKLEAQNITPEGERALEIRDRNAGMIGGNDLKAWCAHVQRFA